MDKNLWPFQPRNHRIHVIMSPPTGFLPLYPHLSPGEKAKHTGRGLYGFKLWCPDCESSVRISKSWLYYTVSPCMRGMLVACLACFGLMSILSGLSQCDMVDRTEAGDRGTTLLSSTKRSHRFFIVHCSKGGLALYSAFIMLLGCTAGQWLGTGQS